MERTRGLRLEPGSPSWPVELDHIDARPDSIWVRGRLDVLKVVPRVAIVGTRAPTQYGEAQARRFADAFARAGLCVVSGLARGIDCAAHQGSLEAGGATIAVLGSGIDVPWPASSLSEAIERDGLLLSELHPGQGPRPRNFPLRNRLISGLCVGVLVIEAAHASGSLITARWAADQGRSVFALPGRVDHPMARGTHRLIREGATLVESPEDVLQDLGLVAAHAAGAGERSPHARERERDPLGAREPGRDALDAKVLEALRGETLSAEELAERLAEPPDGILVTLVGLELSDDVVRGPGGLYRLARA